MVLITVHLFLVTFLSKLMGPVLFSYSFYLPNTLGPFEHPYDPSQPPGTLPNNCLTLFNTLWTLPYILVTIPNTLETFPNIIRGPFLTPLDLPWDLLNIQVTFQNHYRSFPTPYRPFAHWCQFQSIMMKLEHFNCSITACQCWVIFQNRNVPLVKTRLKKFIFKITPVVPSSS